MPDLFTISTVRGTREEKQKLQGAMAKLGVMSFSAFFRLCMLGFLKAMDQAKNLDDQPEWPPQFRTRAEVRAATSQRKKGKP